MGHRILFNLAPNTLIWDLKNNLLGSLESVNLRHNGAENEYVVYYMTLNDPSFSKRAIYIPQKGIRDTLFNYIRLATDVERLLYELPDRR